MIEDDLTLRQEIGDKYIGGRGIEVGAGNHPSLYELIKEIRFIDKRSKEEIETLFKALIPYEVGTVDDARAAFPYGADFLIAHQVLEHSHDPIRTLMSWISLLKTEGVLYISVPIDSASIENRRLKTPIEHLLGDFAFRRGEGDYESREHMYSFVLNWALVEPQDCWYACDVKTFLDVCLSEAIRDGHDFHWHTFGIETICQVVEAAFFFVGASVEFLHVQELNGAGHIACQRKEGRQEPAFLIDYKRRLASALVELT